MNKAVVVAATATAIIDGDDSAYGNAVRGEALVYNNGTGIVYLGDANVTTSNGFPLAAGATLGYAAAAGRLLYGIVATGTENVRVAVL